MRCGAKKKISNNTNINVVVILLQDIASATLPRTKKSSKKKIV